MVTISRAEYEKLQAQSKRVSELESRVDVLMEALRLDIYISDQVLSKTLVLSMETFDNAEVYNHINRAITQTSASCMKLLDAISESVYSLVKGLSFL